MRRDSSDAEQHLWQQLRDAQLGEKFRRQHRVGDLILDFFCARVGLAVELDGGQHFSEDGAERDARRTALLDALGVSVIRFSNAAALTETEAVPREIGRVCQQLSESKQFPPHPSPLPRRGRGDPGTRDLRQGSERHRSRTEE